MNRFALFGLWGTRSLRSVLVGCRPRSAGTPMSIPCVTITSPPRHTTSRYVMTSLRHRLVKSEPIMEAVQNQGRCRKLAMYPVLEAVQNHIRCIKLSQVDGGEWIHWRRRKRWLSPSHTDIQGHMCEKNADFVILEKSVIVSLAIFVVIVAQHLPAG